MNMDAERISAHFLSRFSSLSMPYCILRQTTGTSHIPTMMLSVMTAAMVTYWVAVSALTCPNTRPMALSALLAAMVS